MNPRNKHRNPAPTSTATAPTVEQLRALYSPRVAVPKPDPAQTQQQPNTAK